MNHCQFIMFCHRLWISLRIYRSKPGILTAVADLFATLSSCLDPSNTKHVVHETNPEPPGMHTNRTKSSSNILDCCRMCMDFPGFSSHPRNPSCSVALLALHAPPWPMAASTNLRALSSQNASCAKRTLVARSRSCPQGEWWWLIHPEGMPHIIWCHLRLKPRQAQETEQRFSHPSVHLWMDMWVKCLCGHKWPSIAPIANDATGNTDQIDWDGEVSAWDGD